MQKASFQKVPHPVPHIAGADKSDHDIIFNQIIKSLLTTAGRDFFLP